MQNLEDLKAKLRIDHCIDVWAATPLLAAAITQELKPITESEVNACWEAVLEPEDFDHMVPAPGRTLFGIPIMFRRYADFASLLGGFLGAKQQSDDMVDQWATSSMPKTRAILSAMMEISAEYLSEASARMKRETGVTPGEVLVQVLNTGETFQQTAKRMQFQAKGLRVVKDEDPAP